MAAGLIVVAHNSAGPKEDIVVPFKGEKTGFLAETEEEYADCLLNIYTMNDKKRSQVRQAALEHVDKFSQSNFEKNFIDTFNTFCIRENATLIDLVNVPVDRISKKNK